MTFPTAIEERTEVDAERYWLLVHSGTMYHVSWDDGERLLSLSTEVRDGRSQPQAFSFLPRGASSSGERVTLFLNVGEPIELITEYEHTRRPMQSHWFG